MMRRSLVATVGALALLAAGGGTAAVATGGATAGAGVAAAVSMIHPPLIVSGVRNGGLRHGSLLSTNWSGYAAQSASTFTDAVGSWVQPTATCAPGSTTYSSFWVGIDGYSSDSVEQLGTDSDCVRGKPSYYAWWEMYPAGSSVLTGYPVNAGDTLTAEVARSGSSYKLSLKSSEGWTLSLNESGTDANSSAEWVAEAPEICTNFGFFSFCRLANLTNFGTINFTGAEAAAGGNDAPASTFTTNGGPQEITMVTNSDVVKAQPSPLSASGTGFSVTWMHS